MVLRIAEKVFLNDVRDVCEVGYLLPDSSLLISTAPSTASAMMLLRRYPAASTISYVDSQYAPSSPARTHVSPSPTCLPTRWTEPSRSVRSLFSPASGPSPPTGTRSWCVTGLAFPQSCHTGSPLPTTLAMWSSVLSAYSNSRLPVITLGRTSPRRCCQYLL
jgi:hypothetical protein